MVYLMADIIKHPPKDDLLKYGVLAHVNREERERIYALPFGQFKHAIKALLHEVDLIKYPRRKKSITSESWYNPKTKQQPSKEPSHDESEPHADE